jgi:hypothetical protein
VAWIVCFGFFETTINFFFCLTLPASFVELRTRYIEDAAVSPCTCPNTDKQQNSKKRLHGISHLQGEQSRYSTERRHATLLALLPPPQSNLESSSSLPIPLFMQGYGQRLMDWIKASSPKATSLITSGETGPIHMPACGAASRDYVFDGPEL